MESDLERWARLWPLLRGPVAFTLGALVILVQLANYVAGRTVETQLLVAATGLCGVQAFWPSK